MTTKTLRWLLVVVLLATQAAAAVVILLGMQDRTTAQLNTNARVSLERLAGSVVQRTDQFLAPALAGIKVGHRLVADGMLDPANVRRLEIFLLAELEANPMVAGMYVGRADGSFLMVTRNEEGVLIALIESFGGLRSVLMTQRDGELNYLRTWVDPQNTYDPTHRPWYEVAKTGTGVSITPAYRFFGSGMPGVTAAIELHYPDGSDAGVMGVDIDVRALSAFIADSAGMSTASAVIIDERDVVVASSDPAQFNAIPESNAMTTFASIQDDALQMLRRRLAVDPVSERENLGATEALMVGQQPYMGLATKVSLGQEGLDWTLLIQMPTTQYVGAIDRLFDGKVKMILAILIVTTLISLLGYIGLGEAGIRHARDVHLDPLTGALTRSEFERRMQGMLSRRREAESDSRIYLVALDLDGFKALNDQHGEPTGDLILTRFVSRLTRKMRDGDLIGRNGGDEFVLAVQFDPTVDVLSTIERIREEVVGDGFHSSVGMHQLGFTAGIAGFDPDESLDTLISRANQALVTGKARGRNRCYMAPNHHARWPETVVSAISAQDNLRRASIAKKVQSPD